MAAAIAGVEPDLSIFKIAAFRIDPASGYQPWREIPLRQRA
jgi:hypothetical protein